MRVTTRLAVCCPAPHDYHNSDYRTCRALVSGAILFVTLIATLTLQALIGYSLYRLRVRVRLASQERLPILPVSVSVITRLFCFTGVTFFVLLYVLLELLTMRALNSHTE